jgi:hypothetical protein
VPLSVNLNINKSDRKLLLWAAGIILPIIIALALVPQKEDESEIPSSYSAQSHGAKAAFLLLQELGYQAERWESAPGDLPEKAEGTVLVMAMPLRGPTAEDRRALSNYLAHGGQILITGSSSGLYLPQMQLKDEPFPPVQPKEYTPQALTSLTSGGKVSMSPHAYWKDPSTSVLVHYADNDRPIVVSYKHGKGQVIWWAETGPLTNVRINKSGNLGLFLNSVGPQGKVHVYWDEYFHGTGKSLGAYLWSTPLSFAVWQALAVFLALMITFSRRNGPVRAAHEVSRLSPLEFVHTLGGLYRKAGATNAALEIPFARFRYLVSRKLGLPVDAPVDEIVRTIQGRRSYKDDALGNLGDLLHRIENALNGYELRERDALGLVQQLNEHMMKLNLISQEQLS